MLQIVLRRALLGVVGGGALLVLTGCATSYATPGRAADLKALGISKESLTDSSINQTLAKVPLATFPCGIAAVRIQAPDYQSPTASSYGTGNYCVITERDIEDPKDLERLGKLPMVTGIAPLNRLVLPHQLNSDLELREAAASLHADILLIYTIDTGFEVEDHLSPLSVVTLGLSPNQTARIVTTATAVLMDTRDGYIYGYSEATEHGMQLTNAWLSEQAVNDARRRTETRAFGKLVDGLKGTWTEVVKNYAAPKTTAASR